MQAAASATPLPSAAAPASRSYPHVDVAALAADLRALREELRAELCEDDLLHLRAVERWGRAATALGLATAWIAPNPISALLLSQGTFTRWTMMAHHVLHRGYDRVPGAPARYTTKGFARGGRRYLDWLDWMLPEAWDVEHNLMHHHRLGEAEDPDQVERNLGWLRDSGLPMPLRTALVGVVAGAWKWLYYAPNTLSELQKARARRSKDETFIPTGGLLDPATWSPFDARGRELWSRCLLPYGAWNFLVIPALFAPLGPWAVGSVLANQALAEVLTNLHSFAVIVPNHAGPDVPRFDRPAADRDEFYLRQIVGSVNYACGDDWTDFLHGFLNYQIEHHLFPDLPMRQYQRAHPRVRALCAKHGVPYLQESVWTRLRKTVDVMVGRATMPCADTRAAGA